MRSSAQPRHHIAVRQGFTEPCAHRHRIRRLQAYHIIIVMHGDNWIFTRKDMVHSQPLWQTVPVPESL